MAAAGCTVSVPEVASLIVRVFTPATSAVSLIVTELFCSNEPVVESNRAIALSVDGAGPITAGDQVSAPLPSFFRNVNDDPWAFGRVNV